MCNSVQNVLYSHFSDIIEAVFVRFFSLFETMAQFEDQQGINTESASFQIQANIWTSFVLSHKTTFFSNVYISCFFFRVHNFTVMLCGSVSQMSVFVVFGCLPLWSWWKWFCGLSPSVPSFLQDRTKIQKFCFWSHSAFSAVYVSEIELLPKTIHAFTVVLLYFGDQ